MAPQFLPNELPGRITFRSPGVGPLSGLVSAVFILLNSLVVATGNEKAAASLHQRIDQAVLAGNIVPVVNRAGDAEFVRRVYLDLTGSIPNVEETRDFLNNGAADKRARLVESLLGSRAFVLHMATTFDVWLMERRPAKHVKDPEFRNYLIDSFVENKPYDQLVSEILTADGSEEKNRSAARFYLDREGEPNLLTRDVGRIFFGRDLQCAQCHDHPNISDYLQREYYGLYAFFNRTYLFRPDKKKPALLAEKAEGEANYKSVFTEVAASSLPHLPKGKAVSDPTFKSGDEYLVKPDKKDKKLKPVPKYSRRQQIAKLVANGKNDAFNRNIANRLWAHMMGQGLVEPFDFHHASNPPSNPDLMSLLAEGIVSVNYDIKAFLREIALSESYQRSFEMSSSLLAQAEKVRPTLAVLQEKEKKSKVAMSAAGKGLEEAKMTWEEQKIDLDKKKAELTKVSKKRDDALAASKKSEDAISVAITKITELQKLLVIIGEAVAKNVEVVKLLPKDKELAAASGLMKKKADKVRAEVTKLTAVRNAKEKALVLLEAAHKQPVADAAKFQKQFDTEKARVDRLKQELDIGLARYEKDKSEWKHAQRIMEDTSEMVSYADVTKELKAAFKKAADRKVALAAAQRDSGNKLKLAADLAKTVSGLEGVSAQLAGDTKLVLAVLRKRQDASRSRADVAIKVFKARGSDLASADKLVKERVEKRDAIYASLTDRLTRTSAVGVFNALTPEQLCQSIVTASGERERAVVAGHAEFDKKLIAQAEVKKKTAGNKSKTEKPDKAVKPDGKKPTKKKVPEKQLLEVDRQQYVEGYVDRRLSGATKKFIQLFGGQAGQAQGDFFATADQALFLANDGLVRGWLTPSGGNLTDRLNKIEKPDELVKEIYLSVFNREPEPGETEELKAYLSARSDQKSNAVQELAWSLMSSVEFRFKH